MGGQYDDFYLGDAMVYKRYLFNEEDFYASLETFKISEEKSPKANGDLLIIKTSDNTELMTNGVKGAEVREISDSNGGINYVVEITFDDDASDRLMEITKEYLGESICIYLNDVMISNPRISSIIPDGIL